MTSYRHAGLLAFGIARNVIVAGANEIVPSAVTAGSNLGSSSLVPNASSTAFRCTRRFWRFPPGAESVKRSAAGSVSVRRAVLSVLIASSATPPGVCRRQCA